MSNELLIFIPTYNEHENVEQIINQLVALNLDADLLFVDDNSPDGTGHILDLIAKRLSNLNVIHRSGKLGIGSAHIEGLNWAYEHGYKKLVTMDCDFTHSPEYIKQFIENSRDCDLVVGSRYMLHNSLGGWNLYRKVLTNLGHYLTRWFLGMPYDATGAYRLYSLDRISCNFIPLIQSRGYSFFFESLFILHLNKILIKEIPILLPARVYGHSKMRFKDALHSVTHLAHLFLTKLVNRERYEIVDPFIPVMATAKADHQGWDDYWAEKKNSASLLAYDLLAAFYRKFIIKRALNYFVRKHFSQSAKVLHAGCGSGQVDRDIRDFVSITALDISAAALTFYRKANQGRCELMHGSIFDIPVEDSSFEGIYNLGVMEHFSEGEIKLILCELRRVLKPRAKILLFWPHEYGSSVTVLKFVHYLMNDLLGKGIKLHPDEITRIRSKAQAQRLLSDAGFNMVEYSFGPKDLFTHAVLVGENFK